MKLIKHLTPILLSLTVLTSCYYDNKEALYPNAKPCVADSTVTFSEISQVLKNNCASCHSGSTASISGGGIVFEDSLQVVNKMADIINDISQMPGTSFNAMPKNSSKMDDCSINQMKAWATKISKKTQPQVCDTATISFQEDISPIIQNKCASCHSANTYIYSGGGVKLVTYDDVINRAEKFQADVMQVGVAGTDYNAMPKNGAKLDNCSINKIQAWINQGYNP